MQYIRESSSEEEEVELQEEVEVTTVYFPPIPEGASEVIIPKGFKYEIPLPPVDVRVREDGNLWGHTAAVKFADYYLGDYKTYP